MSTSFAWGKSGTDIHCDNFKGVDKVDWTKARKINLCTLVDFNIRIYKLKLGRPRTRWSALLGKVSSGEG